MPLALLQPTNREPQDDAGALHLGVDEEEAPAGVAAVAQRLVRRVAALQPETDERETTLTDYELRYAIY